jgi:hypothetical protein
LSIEDAKRPSRKCSVGIEGFFTRDASDSPDAAKHEAKSPAPQVAADPARGSTVTGRNFLVAIDGLARWAGWFDQSTADSGERPGAES